MTGWKWLARVKRFVGCGDMQDGLLDHYQRMVPLSDWDIERRVREAESNGDNPFDLCDHHPEERLHGPDSESGDRNED